MNRQVKVEYQDDNEMCTVVTTVDIPDHIELGSTEEAHLISHRVGTVCWWPDK